MGVACAKRRSYYDEPPSDSEDDSHSEDSKLFDDSEDDELADKSVAVATKKCCSHWQRFEHEHRGMGMSSTDMSVLYKKWQMSGEGFDDSEASQTIVHVVCQGKILKIAVALSKDVKFLKQGIFDLTRIKIADQRLMFAGKQLEMGRSVSSYDVQKQSTLVVNESGSREHDVYVRTATPQDLDADWVIPLSSPGCRGPREHLA